MISAMFEAAFRSVLLALTVGVGLQVFRVRNVLAQKAAWGLVLAAAFLMPVLAPIAGRWQLLPSNAIVNLPAHPLSLLASELLSRPKATEQPVAQREPQSARAAIPLPELKTPAVVDHAGLRESTALPAPDSPVSIISDVYQGSPSGTIAPQSTPSPRKPSISDLLWLTYFSVAATLIFRLFFGLASAVLLWMDANPVVFVNARGLADLRVRSSREVSSPVTIGSAVVLPADYVEWDLEKLRIVLAHERSHVRQGDFYLQFLAALYASVLWFSPLGWWLQSKLSDLAETISDRAGLDQAADCSSYAQILLEFAAAPRPTLTGVAMARSGSLSRRIEGLLNDHAFRQAFAGGPARVFIAVLMVPVALFAATTLVRVKAAGTDAQAQVAPVAQTAAAVQTAPQAQPAPAAPAEPPITGQATPEPDVDTTATPAADVAPTAPAPEAAPAAPVVAPAPVAPVAPVGPMGHRVIVVPMIPSKVIVVPQIGPMVVRVPNMPHIYPMVQKANAEAYSYSYSTDGESYGIVRGSGEHLSFSGDLHSVDIEKIRKQAHGDFLWFKRDGKYYFVDDPATLAQIEAMYKPIDDLGKQQEELGRKQEELGKQQEALGRQQEKVSVSAPDISREMADLNASIAKLQAGKTVTQDELADLQGKLGDLQGRLGELQGEMGNKQGQFGAQQGRLGAEQGKLGAEQGRLGAEQGRLSREADRKVKSIIDESMQNGKAHPVE